MNNEQSAQQALDQLDAEANAYVEYHYSEKEMRQFMGIAYAAYMACGRKRLKQSTGDKELCDIASKISLDAALSQVSAEGYTVYWFNDEQFVPEWQVRQLQQRGAHLRELLAHKTAMVEHLDSQLSTPKEEKEEWISVKGQMITGWVEWGSGQYPKKRGLHSVVLRDTGESWVAWWNDIERRFEEAVPDFTDRGVNVTHWMPMPEPPAPPEQNDKM